MKKPSSGMKGKKNVTAKVTPSGSPTRVVAGGPGKSFPQQPMPGPGSRKK